MRFTTSDSENIINFIDTYKNNNLYLQTMQAMNSDTNFPTLQLHTTAMAVNTHIILSNTL